MIHVHFFWINLQLLKRASSLEALIQQRFVMLYLLFYSMLVFQPILFPVLAGKTHKVQPRVPALFMRRSSEPSEPFLLKFSGNNVGNEQGDGHENEEPLQHYTHNLMDLLHNSLADENKEVKHWKHTLGVVVEKCFRQSWICENWSNENGFWINAYKNDYSWASLHLNL